MKIDDNTLSLSHAVDEFFGHLRDIFAGDRECSQLGLRRTIMEANGRRRDIAERGGSTRPHGGASGQNHLVWIGRHGPDDRDSDLDLLVVEPEPANARDRSVKIRRALGDVQYPVDVIVMSSERFEETKDIIGGLAYPAHKYGRVLYEAA